MADEPVNDTDATPTGNGQPHSMKFDMKGPGVPRLLEHLAEMAGESVYLWLKPGTTEKWRVWTGAPAGTGGSEWGGGTTPYEALLSAFEHLTEAIFAGRIVR